MEQNTSTSRPWYPRHCPIEAVSRERGEMLAAKIKSGEPNDLNALRAEHGHGDHHRGEHGHGKHGRPGKNTPDGLLQFPGLR